MQKTAVAFLVCVFVCACGDDDTDVGDTDVADTATGDTAVASDASADAAEDTDDAVADTGATDTNIETPEVTLRLESSFETALGRSNEALLDGGRWDEEVFPSAPLLAVVTAENGVTPIDGTNMLRISLNAEESHGILSNDAFDPESDHRYLRFYVNVQCIETEAVLTHYVEDYDGSSYNFFWRTTEHRVSTGRYRMGWSSGADQSICGSGYLSPNISSWGQIGAPSPTDAEPDGDANGAECGRWYRVEQHVACVEPGCMNRPGADVRTRVELRVYNRDGEQVLGHGQFRSMRLDGVWQSGTPGVLHDESSCYAMRSGIPTLVIGNNGQDGERGVADAWMYFDRVATSSDGWIGR